MTPGLGTSFLQPFLKSARETLVGCGIRSRNARHLRESLGGVVLLSTMATSAVDYKDLPASRFVEWKRAAIDFPTSAWTTVEVSTLGIYPGNALSDSIAKKFMAALAQKPAAGVTYHFPQGVYTFESPICIGPAGFKDSWNVTGADVNNVVIRGDGPDRTRFLFDCDVTYFKALLWIEKPAGYSARNATTSLTSIPAVGAEELSLPSGAPRAAVGDLVEIKSDNDPAVMFPPQDSGMAWYRKFFDPADTIEGNYPVDFAESYGQISEVVSIAGAVAAIDPPVLLPFRQALNPRVSVYVSRNRTENIGIQDIYIEHIVSDARYTAMGVNDIFDIAFRFVRNGYVRNVESRRTARGHVIVEYSHNVLIADSKFSLSRAYGVGGAGYGVCIQNRSSDVTVENNEFMHLRHAVVLKEGACRNVIAYNWSHDWGLLDPAVTDAAGQPIKAEADMSIHGMYSHHNLFEGNVCYNIVYADYWGPTGPKVTTFRNRCYGTDTVCGIRLHDFSLGENVVANVIPAPGGMVIDSSCRDAYQEGNVVHGTAQWHTLTAASVLPPSLYLEQAPDFWIAGVPFPPFGPDVAGSAGNRIPVELLGDSAASVGRLRQPAAPGRSGMYSGCTAPGTMVTTTYYDCAGRRLSSRRSPAAQAGRRGPSERLRPSQAGTGVVLITVGGRSSLVAEASCRSR